MSENPIFSYTHRDYEGSRQEGIAKIPIISKGQWTDLNATDPGVIILDYVHALVDMMNYYQDHQAMEAFITTAKERANIFRLAKQLSYSIRSAKGAICDVTFTSSMTYSKTIKIPKYTVVSTLSGIKYLTMEDAYLKAGDHVITIPCSQGTLVTMRYTGTGISRFSPIEGAKNQSIRLVDSNIDIDSVYITDNIDRIWNPVEYITFSTEIDRVYQVEMNPDNTVTIKFGDGERGIIPKTTDILNISYVTTLAEEGRVSENSIVVLNTPIYDDNGVLIDFMINNNRASSGGSTAQSSQEIRDLAPGAIKAQNRAVTLNDFENLAKMVDGVADAKAYDINVKPDLCLYHEVKVLITPKDTEGSIDLLRNRVYEYLYQRMIPPTNLQVLTPSYVYLDIDITVRMLENTNRDISASRLQYSVEQTIKSYFKDREGAIAEPFYPSDLIAIVSSLPYVRSVTSINPISTVNVEDLSVIRLGSLNVKVQ